MDGRNTPGSDGSEAGADGRTSAVRRVGGRLVPGPVRRSYALKFAVAMAVVILVITAVGVGSYVQIRGIIEDDAENTLQSTAALQADSVSEWMSGMQAQVRGFAGTDAYATGDPERIDEALSASAAQASADVAGIHYVDADGRIAASTVADLEGSEVDTSRPEWAGPIATARNGSGDEWRVGVSDRAYESNGRLLMAFAGRVRVGEGVLVVVGDVRSDFEQLHRSRSIVRTQLLDPEGRNVFASRRSGPSALAETAAFERAVAGEPATRERASDVVAFAPVRATPWVVATEAPKSQLYQASETVGRNVVVLVAASVTTLAVVGFVLGRGTVVPLIRLRRRAEAMEDGDLDVDLSTTREDEIGRLFVAFDGMREALRAQIRESEAARERAERSRAALERQNERLDQFASTVSHDLRNPLNVASGHLQLIERKLDDLDEEVDEALAPHVEKVDTAHARIEEIVGDVLTLARQGRDIEETQTVDLATVARDAWATVDSDGATLSVPGTRTLAADPDRLRQAFENLFRNAVEHGPPDDAGDGDLTVTVELTADGFAVADDGTGVPPDAVDEVFEYGHTTDADGTGFGLAIVETVVEAHGWSVAVDTDYDDGARFVVSGVFDGSGDDSEA
ncbi:sensor histidine kinase [Halosimplex halophilum]|uniref:sensor histidine kinase n=1 Tax=Halosimplex halophilum TaxID=2559572 RepID=UPI00107F854A|nr:HAMP domain-containing sensor histidine kinase [Halosimplex halophilum]